MGAKKIFGGEDILLVSNDGTIDSMEGVRRCAEYLKSQRFVRSSYAK